MAKKGYSGGGDGAGAPIRTYCPQQPSWNADGTPSNEDALQITAWIVHHLEQGDYSFARYIWMNQGKVTFPSAYPGIMTGVTMLNERPRRRLKDWVESRARTPRNRATGEMGWRELLKPGINMSEQQLYWLASPEVREQIEDCIIVCHDGPKAKVAHRAARYINQLREYVANRERREAAAKAFMAMHEDDRAEYMRKMMAGLGKGNSLLDTIAEPRSRHGKASKDYRDAMSSKDAALDKLRSMGVDPDSFPNR